MLHNFGPKIWRNLRDRVDIGKHEDHIYNQPFNNGLKPILSDLGLRFAKKDENKKKSKDDNDETNKVVKCAVSNENLSELVDMLVGKKKEN